MTDFSAHLEALVPRPLGNVFALFLGVCSGGCANETGPAIDSSEAYPGGETTVSVVPFPSSELPARNLPTELRPDFYAGRALSGQPWVKAPTATTARDGLGPLYNARSCLGCHEKGGRGHPPLSGEALGFGGFLRLSVPGSDAREGAVPEPTYGLQLQDQSVALTHQLGLEQETAEGTSGEVRAEGTVSVTWHDRSFAYPDRTRVELREPTLTIERLGYGELHPDVMMSLRIAPPMHGIGLIEAIPEEDIEALADPEDDDGDGISGRLNRVWDQERQEISLGRFGLKANRASVAVTVAGAFAFDIGISNRLFPLGPCTEAQTACADAPTGVGEDGFEISDELLALVIDFSRNIGVPERRTPYADEVLEGRAVFYEIGCPTCHHPHFRTREDARHAHLAGQDTWPYSDFLLHDMGKDLADGRPDFQADGREWRTAPLWGVGVSARIGGHENYLHDGRARTLEEAILWHGGEAAGTRDRFAALGSAARSFLLTFLGSL